MAEKMELIWGSGSVPCWRAMIVLEEKGLQGYKSKLISFGNQEHKGEDVLKLNPRGQVPVFKDGDVVVNESLAICDYLERKYPNKCPLYPNDPAQAGKVLQRIQEANSNVQKITLVDYMFFAMRNKDKMDDPDVKAEIEKKKDAAKNEIKMWEGYLEKDGGGKFLCGDSFTMADVVFFPFVAFWFRTGLNGENHTTLQKYYNMLKDRKSIAASWPPHWKESEGQDFFKDV